MEKIWFQNYPEGSEKFLDTSKYESILDMFDKAVREHPDRPAYINMGQVLTFRKLEERSRAFAAYLQNEFKLQRGDRVALMMPNLLQYPIALFWYFTGWLNCSKCQSSLYSERIRAPVAR